jgi:HAE1 family hydrophobic/amphiphilic exporter-1
VDVSVFTSDFGGGFKQIQLQLRGQDVQSLAAGGGDGAAEVEKVPGAVDIGLSTKGSSPSSRFS